MILKKEEIDEPIYGVLALGWADNKTVFNIVSDKGIVYTLKDGDMLRVWSKSSGTQLLNVKILTDSKTGVQTGYLDYEWKDIFAWRNYRAEVIPRKKRVKVEEQPQKESKTRWRSRKASKMVLKAGESRSVSGRRGSGKF